MAKAKRKDLVVVLVCVCVVAAAWVAVLVGFTLQDRAGDALRERRAAAVQAQAQAGAVPPACRQAVDNALQQRARARENTDRSYDALIAEELLDRETHAVAVCHSVGVERSKIAELLR